MPYTNIRSWWKLTTSHAFSITSSFLNRIMMMFGKGLDCLTQLKSSVYLMAGANPLIPAVALTSLGLSIQLLKKPPKALYDFKNAHPYLFYATSMIIFLLCLTLGKCIYFSWLASLQFALVMTAIIQCALIFHNKIDVQAKEKFFDPYRVLINQFLRLFSGQLLAPFAGKHTQTLRPLIQKMGIVFNLLNSLISLSINPEKRLVYTAISSIVLIISCFAITNLATGHGGLLMLSVPLSLWGGIIQACAEVYEQIQRTHLYIKSLVSSHFSDLNTTKRQDNLQLLSHQKVSIRRKQLGNSFTWLIAGLSWVPFLCPITMASLGTPGLLGLAGIGFFIAVASYQQELFFFHHLSGKPYGIRASNHTNPSLTGIKHKKSCNEQDKKDEQMNMLKQDYLTYEKSFRDFSKQSFFSIASFRYLGKLMVI